MSPLRRSLVALLWLGAMLASPVAARADQPNPSFFLVNRSRQAITEVYASPSNTDDWGRNRITAKIDPNANAPVRFVADGTCVFDIRVVYEDGHDEQRRSVNTCNVDDIAFSGSAPRSAPSPGPTPPASGNAERDPSFRVVNRGNREIDEVYARIAGTTDWGRDRLGDGVIGGGNYKVIPLPHGQCVWDVRVVFADGQNTEKRRLNLCDVTDLPIP